MTGGTMHFTSTFRFLRDSRRGVPGLEKFMRTGYTNPYQTKPRESRLCRRVYC
jgi:hypothetical protein